MSYTPRMDYKTIANAKITARLKQIAVLFATIIIGILISVSLS